MSNFNRNTIKQGWMIGLVAAAGAVVGLPIAGLVRAPVTIAADGDSSLESLKAELNQVEAALQEEDARFNRQTRGMKKDSRVYQDAQKTHADAEHALRRQRQDLRDRIQRYDGKNIGQGRYEEKLDNIGDAIENENKRYAERMRNLPRGSAAAAEETARHEARLNELRGRKADVREDRQDIREVRGAERDLKQDQRQLDNEVAAENARHAKAKKFLPAYSEAAQEEDREHEKRLREIEVRRSAVVGQRDIVVGDKQVERRFDDQLDQIDKQIQAEEARHARRVKEVNRGSVAAANEDRQYNQTMSDLRARRAQIAGQDGALRGANERVVYLRQVIKAADDQLGAENARHERLMNQLDAGSAGEAAERDRHSQAVARIQSDRRAAETELASLGGGAPSASGR